MIVGSNSGYRVVFRLSGRIQAKSIAKYSGIPQVANDSSRGFYKVIDKNGKSMAKNTFDIE